MEMIVEMIVEMFGENSPYWHCVPLKPAGQRHSRSPVSSHWPPLKHVEASHRPADTHCSLLISYQTLTMTLRPYFFFMYHSSSCSRAGMGKLTPRDHMQPNQLLNQAA